MGKWKTLGSHSNAHPTVSFREVTRHPACVALCKWPSSYLEIHPVSLGVGLWHLGSFKMYAWGEGPLWEVACEAYLWGSLWTVEWRPWIGRLSQERCCLGKDNGSQHLLDAILFNPLKQTAQVLVIRTQADVYCEMGQDPKWFARVISWNPHGSLGGVGAIVYSPLQMRKLRTKDSWNDLSNVTPTAGGRVGIWG